MFRKLSFKMLALSCMFAIPLIFGAATNGYASGWGAPGGECPSKDVSHLTGPALVGTVTITPSIAEDACGTFVPPGPVGKAKYNFVGRCAQDSSTIIKGCDPEVDFTELTAESLKGYVIPDENVPEALRTRCRHAIQFLGQVIAGKVDTRTIYIRVLIEECK